MRRNRVEGEESFLPGKIISEHESARYALPTTTEASLKLLAPCDDIILSLEQSYGTHTCHSERGWLRSPNALNKQHSGPARTKQCSLGSRIGSNGRETIVVVEESALPLQQPLPQATGAREVANEHDEVSVVLVPHCCNVGVRSEGCKLRRAARALLVVWKLGRPKGKREC